MRICNKCVQPDTRPSIKFDEEGVCPACRFAETAPEIDWDARLDHLKNIVKETQKRNNSNYDCILGVSGGKDSVRLAMFAKEDLGLNTLLVNCSSSPEQVTQLGVENLSNMVELGFDLISINPGPKTWKHLIKKSFFQYCNIHKSTEMALYASCPRLALSWGIPLMFIGENPAITLGELGTGSIDGDASKMRHSNTIKGGPETLVDDSVPFNKLLMYRYPSEKETERADLVIQYLGYYIKDFGKMSNGKFSMEHGMKIRGDVPENMGDITGYEQLDDHFALINQMLKYLKLGFGKVSDQVCEEIRLGTMTREEGIEQVRKYDGKCHEKYILGFCEFLGITKDEFWRNVDKFVNKDLFVKNPQGEWVFKEDPYQ